MTHQEDLIRLAQEAAQRGDRPHQILRTIADHVKPKWEGHIPYIAIEACLLRAFRVPLREARDIERWVGLSQRGDLTNDAIDQLLSPWIQQFLTDNP